jgi:hypothetical protein
VKNTSRTDNPMLRFLSAIWADWLARMSGPLTVPFTLAAFFLPSSIARISFTILAVIAGLVTCYRIWKAEYDKYQAETAKAAFHFGVPGGIRSDSTPPAATFPIAFQVNVCNYRNVTTNIVEIDLDGSKLLPPIEFSEVHSPLVGKTLEFGIGVTGMPVYATAHVKGMSLADVPPIKMDNLRFFCMTGF